MGAAGHAFGSSLSHCLSTRRELSVDLPECLVAGKLERIRCRHDAAQRADIQATEAASERGSP